MGATQRQSADPVDQATAAARGSRPVMSLIAFIERLFPEAAALGTSAPPSREVVRLRHDPSFSFSNADVSGVAAKSIGNPNDPWEQARRVVELTTTFLGLTGTVSPLPNYISEEVIHEEPDDSPRRAFLDVFHHRLLSLLYRAATHGDMPLQYRTGGRDEWSRRVLALAGVDTSAEGVNRPLPLWRFLRLAPLLILRCRNGEVLERALQDVLQDDIGDGKVEIVQFVGAWVPFDKQQQISLARQNSTLGVGTRLGTRVYDSVGQFRVRIGPVSFETYNRLRPGQELFRVVDGVISLVLRDALEWEMEVVIAAGYAPAMRLSAGGGSRLAHESWLGGRQTAERRVVVRRDEET